MYSENKAFTLAEVLITLVIIGIVAALTLHNLVYSYKKRIIETRLQKTYSLLNQAVTMSIIDNGETKEWSGSSDTSDNMEIWFKKYFGKYLKYNKITSSPGTTDTEGNTLYNGIYVYLNDGSVLSIKNSNNNNNGIAHDWHYFIDGKKLNNKAILDAENNYEVTRSGYISGRDLFSFYFDTDKNRFMPYGYHQLTGDENDIRDVFMNKPVYGCSQSGAYMCSALIMYDGWKIKDDYPVKL